MSNLDVAKCPKCFEELQALYMEGDFYPEEFICYSCDNCKETYTGCEERFRDLNQHLNGDLFD